MQLGYCMFLQRFIQTSPGYVILSQNYASTLALLAITIAKKQPASISTLRTNILRFRRDKEELVAGLYLRAGNSYELETNTVAKRTCSSLILFSMKVLNDACTRIIACTQVNREYCVWYKIYTSDIDPYDVTVWVLHTLRYNEKGYCLSFSFALP